MKNVKKTWETEKGEQMFIPYQAGIMGEVSKWLKCCGHSIKTTEDESGIYAYYEILSTPDSIALDDKKMLFEKIGYRFTIKMSKVLLKDYIDDFEKLFNYLNADTIYDDDESDDIVVDTFDEETGETYTTRRKSKADGSTIYNRIVSLNELKYRM